ncbi:hypothetical protein BGX21_004369 [Mortierella sp. AD011]|nr:hypothetical protein BGX20_004250 [Mortierella sp. AD010]KAF9373645.1 hypothetical protein BGX21_004369 [Mortierella sp. AD011]
MSSDLKSHQGATDVNPQSQQQQQQHEQAQQQQHQQPQQSNSSGDVNASNSNSNSNGQLQAAEQPKKAKRKRITPEQLEDLVGLFEKTDTPSFEIRESLAKKLGMTNREIQVWFQNRRAKANRIKINEQAALHHQHHMQQQQLQQQQHLQGHHHLSHHRSNSANGFVGSHPGLVHSAPSTPLQNLPSHHHHHHQGSTGGGPGSMPSSAQEPPSSSSSFGYFGANGSSSPPMAMPTPTPRVHASHANRRPVSLYNIGSHGLQQYQQQQQPQKPGQFQPMQHSSSSSSSPAPFGSHASGQGHPAGPYGMDIILPTNSSSSSSRPILPPPISTMTRRPGQSVEEYEESRRSHRHERTLSEGYPSDYISPTSMSPISPPPERHMDTQYRDDHEEDSPTSVTHSSPFTNGGNNNTSGINSNSNTNRHSASLSSFGLKSMIRDEEPNVVPREKSSNSAYYNNPAQATKNRRSYDDDLYDEHQQLMRDSFNMETRLVISEDEPRPESAIDILAYAAAFIQESEEHKKDNKDVDEKRDALGQLSSNKRQSFHGPSGYPSKEPFQEESSRYSSSGMSWEASTPVSGNSGNDVMPVPRRRGGDDGPYAQRRRPVTYSGSGYLYDHQENTFLPQSPSSFGSYRPSSSGSAGSRRLSTRNSTEAGGGGGLLLQRGLTRPRRSSSTAASGLMNSHLPSSTMPMPVLPPIISENNSRLLSPAMVPSPQFGASRLTRQDSQGNGISNMNGARDSPGSDSFSHTSRDDMEDIEEDPRAAKRRSGTFFGLGSK